MRTYNCPVCPGQGIHLGTLGRLARFRCESCGMEFHKDASLLEDFEDEDFEDEDFEDDRFAFAGVGHESPLQLEL